MLSETVLLEVGNVLAGRPGRHDRARVVSSVSGGSINQCYCIAYGDEHFFLKANNAERFPGMFEKEARGLELLREASAISVPEVLGMGEAQNVSFLILEWIESGKNNSEA